MFDLVEGANSKTLPWSVCESLLLCFVLSNSGAKHNSCVQCGSNKLPLLLLLRRHPPGSLAPERAYSLFVNIECCLRSKYQYDGSVKIFTLKRMVLWAVWGILAFRFTIALETRLLAGESLWLWRSHLKIRWTLVQLSRSVTQICHKQIWLTLRNNLFELEGGSNGAHGLHVQPNTPVAGWWFCSFSKPLTKMKALVGPFGKFFGAMKKVAEDKDSQSSVTQGFGDSA